MTKQEILIRLEAKTLKGSGHWLWHGGTTGSGGYGRVRIDLKVYLIHRLSAFIHWDFDLESKVLILHKCDIPRCWNPDCLFEGDHEDNMKDAASKGRCGRPVKDRS